MQTQPRAFLVTYRPICGTASGREAMEHLAISPYVDGSCRREPDFESKAPSITALCRAGKFAPRLRPTDRVAYITKRGRYEGRPSHWRIVSLLAVQRRFESHDEAAVWYREQRVALPRNLIVAGNLPVRLEETDGVIPSDLRCRKSSLSAEEIVRLWDGRYRLRARTWGVVLVCNPIFVQLRHPPAITEEEWLAWIGRVPSTRNPPEITDDLWRKLRQHTETAGY